MHYISFAVHAIIQNVDIYLLLWPNLPPSLLQWMNHKNQCAFSIAKEEEEGEGWGGGGGEKKIETEDF